MEAEAGFSQPEMMFGHNQLVLRHASGFTLCLAAKDACVAAGLVHLDEHVKVDSAAHWNKHRAAAVVGSAPKQTDFNWAYATLYVGTVNGLSLVSPPQAELQLDCVVPKRAAADAAAPAAGTKRAPMEPDEAGAITVPVAPDRPPAAESSIDYTLLKRPDPIQWYQELPMFEDELHDHGMASLSVRIRVMPSCFFCLMRYWLRLDHVLLMVVDTRVFHCFGTDRVVVERKLHQDSVRALAARGLPAEMTAYRDPNEFLPRLTLRDWHLWNFSLAERAER